MAKTFEQFHFSLIEREQGDLLEDSLSREEWLREKFSETIEFLHHGNKFFWVPQDYSKEFIVGIVERQRIQPQRTPPEDGAQEIEGKYWTGAMVIIDPNNRPDGQKVAFEDNTSLGQANAILSSLVANVNRTPGRQYSLRFKPLFRGDSFWRFADKHGGKVEYITFKFTVPNMIFSAGGGTKKGLRRIGEDTNAQEIELKLESDDGVDTDSQAVKEGMAYGEEGNARVTAKALTGERWSSTQRKLTAKMHSILNLSEAKAGEVTQWLKQALDRGEDSNDTGFDNPDDWDRGD